MSTLDLTKYFNTLKQKGIIISSEIIDPEEEYCAIVEFFKREAQKPAWQRASSCMISCSCSRHRTYC